MNVRMTRGKGLVMTDKGDIKYWRDSEGVHHAPKRPLDDIIIG